MKDSYENDTIGDTYEGVIEYIGDKEYSIYKWQATVYVNGLEKINAVADWRWWLPIWLRYAAFTLRRQNKQRKINKEKPTKRVQL